MTIQIPSAEYDRALIAGLDDPNPDERAASLGLISNDEDFHEDRLAGRSTARIWATSPTASLQEKAAAAAYLAVHFEYGSPDLEAALVAIFACVADGGFSGESALFSFAAIAKRLALPQRDEATATIARLVSATPEPERGEYIDVLRGSGLAALAGKDAEKTATVARLRGPRREERLWWLQNAIPRQMMTDPYPALVDAVLACTVADRDSTEQMAAWTALVFGPNDKTTVAAYHACVNGFRYGTAPVETIEIIASIVESGHFPNGATAPDVDARAALLLCHTRARGRERAAIAKILHDRAIML